MIWHPSPASQKSDGLGSSPLTSPMSITAWFENGSQLDSIVVFPKFTWRQTFQNQLNYISRVPNYIQLLAVVRVVEPTALDRMMYPFARLKRSFVIGTHDGEEYVFEAPSEWQRESFVKKLKFLVARLASSVIVHDEGLLQEFFTSGDDVYADYDEDIMSTDSTKCATT